MSNEQWNDIWKILKSGQLKFVDNVNSDILCTICKKVLINAHGSPCGCRYCLECITTYLNGEEKICPGNTNLCNKEIININKVFLDHMMNMKISRLIVKCPQEKCKCQDELRNIENHMIICDFRSVDCPYAIMGCNYFDSDLKKHMLNEIISHTKLIFEYIDNLKNEIKLLQEDKNDLKKYKKDIKKYIQELHLKYENDFENIKVKLNEIEYKSDDKQKCVSDLQLECDRNDKEIKESKDLLKKSEEERKEDAIGMKQKIRMLNEEMETLKKETLKNKKLTNLKCENDIKEIKEKIKELENKCDEVKVNGQNDIKREVKMIKDDLCKNKGLLERLSYVLEYETDECKKWNELNEIMRSIIDKKLIDNQKLFLKRKKFILKTYCDQFTERIINKLKEKKSFDKTERDIINGFCNFLNIIGKIFPSLKYHQLKLDIYLKIFICLKELKEFVHDNIYAVRIAEIFLYCICNVLKAERLSSEPSSFNDTVKKYMGKENFYDVLRAFNDCPTSESIKLAVAVASASFFMMDVIDIKENDVQQIQKYLKETVKKMEAIKTNEYRGFSEEEINIAINHCLISNIKMFYKMETDQYERLDQLNRDLCEVFRTSLIKIDYFTDVVLTIVTRILSLFGDPIKNKDGAYNNRIIGKFTRRESFNKSDRALVNIFCNSLNIIGQNSSSNLLPKFEFDIYDIIFIYLNDLEEFVQTNIYAVRIIEVLLYCLCNLLENKSCQYQFRNVHSNRKRRDEDSPDSHVILRYYRRCSTSESIKLAAAVSLASIHDNLQILENDTEREIQRYLKEVVENMNKLNMKEYRGFSVYEINNVIEKKCVDDSQLECVRNNKEIKESKDLLKKLEEERKEDAIGMKQEIRMLNEEIEKMKKETLENKNSIYDSKLKYESENKEIKEKLKQIEHKLTEEQDPRKICKADISGSSNFQHLDHMGLNDHFFKNPNDENLKKFLRDANLENLLDDDKSKKDIYVFVEKHGGLSKLGNEMRQKENRERKAPGIPKQNIPRNVPPPPSRPTPSVYIAPSNVPAKPAPSNIASPPAPAPPPVAPAVLSIPKPSQNKPAGVPDSEPRGDLLSEIVKFDPKKLKAKSISDSKLNCENNNKEINERIKELTNQCDEVKRFCGREFVWQIDKWTEKRKQSYITSESFYSHTNGYKMCLSVDPNGSGCGEGTHLSVHCYVMRGECDDILPWPFKYGVTFELIDQHATQIYTSSTVTYGGQYDQESGIEYDRDIRKPIDWTWICCNQKFVSLKELSSDNDRSLIDNDQIFIRCRVHIIN